MIRQRSVNLLEHELANEENEFLLLCFSDVLGIDLPTKYYVLELLPYLMDNLESWEEQMQHAKSVWEDRFAQFDMDP